MTEFVDLSKKIKRAKRDHAPALTRGLKILELVASSEEGLSMAEIGRALDLAKSSVHGLCTVLTIGGMLERSPGGKFRLGLKIVDLANARLESSDLASEFYNRWDLLNQFTDEGGIIAVLDGTDVVYVACRNSKKSLGITFRIGMRLPACFTATGKALLSTLADDDVRVLYNDKKWAKLTENSVVNPEALIKQLAEIRGRGYSIDDGECRTHMYSIGAPVPMREKHMPPAAIAVSFIRSDITTEKSNAAIPAILKLADELSRAHVYS